ncbi:single-stranded DNA-binding protein [Actinosynnema sp. CS-041913]|uniref:single-stranded DNA-binding protein n=1 Tax=Actinosynnema sp. CS-041913 TaxID=3239917 RepID=UPI003D8D305B
MAGETTLTIIGNLTSAPELRHTQAGASVANFTIASTPRTFDRQAGEWKDADTLFLRCTCWNQLADHVAESIGRGTRVIAQGRLRQRSYEKDGEKRTTMEFEVDEIGAALRYATVKITKIGNGTMAASGGGTADTAADEFSS